MIPNNRKGPTPNDPPVPIKQIFIAGTMSGWKSIEMTRTKGDAYFCVIIDCYEGDVFYKFCVDGEWTIDFSMASFSIKKVMISFIQSYAYNFELCFLQILSPYGI